MRQRSAKARNLGLVLLAAPAIILLMLSLLTKSSDGMHLVRSLARLGEINNCARTMIGYAGYTDQAMLYEGMARRWCREQHTTPPPIPAPDFWGRTKPKPDLHE